MDSDKLKDLRIDDRRRGRPQRSIWSIFVVVFVLTCAALFFAWPRAADKIRIHQKEAHKAAETRAETRTLLAQAPAQETLDAGGKRPDNDVVLTVSGYIINGTRIELSPRFMGVVKWIGVEKGDAVTNGQVVVQLDDVEFQAQLREVEGEIASAKVALRQAELTFDRISRLARTEIESKQVRDDAELKVEAARAALIRLDGTLQRAQAHVDWCTIRSPIDGIILEKMVDPDELVVPQSFGGPQGPSTALVAIANPRDIQVEIDLNEADLSKIYPKQKCRVSPEAFPDKVYQGHIKEISPEADRSKGTLQIKVQVENPDRYLTPELSARVDFLK